MKMSETINKIAPALIKFNAEVSKISKDAANPFHKNKYSTLDQIIDEVRPTLQKHGLSVMQNASGEDGNITVKTFLLHESGEWMESEGVTLKPQKNDPQGAGGAVTYARRYDICAFLSLNTGDDDDGNSASGLGKGKKGNQQSKPIPQKNIGVIKTKVMRFADMREKKPVDVYEALSIKEQDLPDFTEEQSVELIEKLDSWIKKADKEMANK